MIPIGDVYRFKAEVEEELTPSFHATIMSSLGKPYPTSFGDANYVFSITCFTEPLKRFIEDVIKSLNFGTTPFPLVRGFGFGKTHSLIVLWHIFTNAITNDHLRRLLSENEILKQTFVLACDVSERAPPLETFAETLFASTKGMEKDYDLLRVLSDLEEKYDRNELLSPTRFADFLAEFVNESKRKFQKTPKFLVLIDELGYGTIKRIDEYADSKFTKEELIEDIRRLISFVTTIAEELKRLGSSVAIVYAFAEQDINSLDVRIKMHYSNENVRAKLEGLKELIRTDLIERLKRYSGGIERAPLQLNPLQNIEIAKFRVLKAIGDESRARDSASSYIQNLLETFRIFDETDIHNYVEAVRQFYPISPDLLNLLKKAHDSAEFPKTEYVRTVISLLKDAVKNALQSEPDAPLIGVGFLSLKQSALSDILDDFAQSDWFTILKDIELAINSSKNRKLAEIISKLILSKATTSNILALIEEREIEKYGASQEEIQASIVSTFNKDEVSSALEEFPEVLMDLRVRSARIVERIVDGKRLFIPSVVRHVIAQKESYVTEEKKRAHDSGILTYIRESSVQPLLNKLSKSANILTKDYKELKELSNVHLIEPTCFIIPPWDFALYREIEQKGHDNVVDEAVNILNDKFERGEIVRAPYLIVLIPNLSKVSDLVNSLIEYNASIKFLDYLKKEESIVKNYVERVRTEILTKRTGEKVDERELSKHIVQSVQQQIREAKNTAMAEVVRCARDVIANLLRLYEKPIVYNLTHKNFVFSTRFLERREETINKIVPEIKTKDVDKYSDMIKKLVEDILNLVGFEEKHTVVKEALFNRIKKELEEYEMESISIDELLENLILGTYGILPKTEEIARKSIESLNGELIDYSDKIVKIIVDKKNLLFRYEKKEPKMKIESIQVSPKKLTYNPKENVKLNISIVNEGARGDCILKIESCDDRNVIVQGELKEIETKEERALPLELVLPEDRGEHRYKVSVMHDPIEIDDEEELVFSVEIEIPPLPPEFVKEITADITETDKESIIDFVSSNQNAFEECRIYMESDDFDISIDVKSLKRGNLDVLIRFVQPLARRCNTVPKIHLKTKHGMLKKDDVKFEADVKLYDQKS